MGSQRKSRMAKAMAEVAIVTGAARGIGRAIADALADAGFRVACLGLEESADCLPDGSVYYRTDVARIEDHAAVLGQVAAELGEPTCLVNNAGVTSLTRGDMLDLTPESYDRTLAINLRAGFFLAQAFARRRLARPVQGARASIVFVGSVNAEIVGENRADYCLSKAGVAMMAKLFAVRLAKDGIAVFEVRPGVIRTAMTRPATERYDALIEAGGIPMGRWGEPEDVGRAVAALATGAIPYATGIHVDVGGGMQLHRV
jgi:NAD(P)-dependent dehydrogenase (short-subunit alcohol dehydrogenase family)